MLNVAWKPFHVIPEALDMQFLPTVKATVGSCISHGAFAPLQPSGGRVVSPSAVSSRDAYLRASQLAILQWWCEGSSGCGKGNRPGYLSPTEPVDVLKICTALSARPFEDQWYVATRECTYFMYFTLLR